MTDKGDFWAVLLVLIQGLGHLWAKNSINHKNTPARKLLAGVGRSEEKFFLNADQYQPIGGSLHLYIADVGDRSVVQDLQSFLSTERSSQLSVPGQTEQ